MSELLSRSCQPIAKGTPPLDENVWRPLLESLGDGWEVQDGHLRRAFVFPAFETGLDFVNQVGALAEADNHHPDIFLDRRKVEMSLFTYDCDGLSENDFIIAAKVTDAISGLATARMVDVSALKGETAPAAIQKIEGDALSNEIAKLGDGWTLGDDGRLARTFEMRDFVAALSLVNRIGTLAREHHHHPAIRLRYTRVDTLLFTYPVDGISRLDLELAGALDKAATR